MNHCRQCGIKLTVTYNHKQKEIAKKNVDYLPRLLREEGEFMEDGVKSNMKRIIYESELCLNDEADFAHALCEKCSKSESEKLKKSADTLTDGFIDLDKTREQSDAFMRKWNAKQLIRKIKRGW